MKFTVAFLLLTSTVVAFQAPRPHGVVATHSLFSTIGDNDGESKPATPTTPPSASSSSDSDSSRRSSKRPARTSTPSSPAVSTPTASTTAAATAVAAVPSTPTTTTSSDGGSSTMPASLQEIKLPAMMSNIDLDGMKDKLPDMENLMASLQPNDGRKFGERGEIYVAGQAVMVVAVAIGGGIPLLSDGLSVLGPVLLIAGLAGIVLSISDLDTSFSPFTTPNPKGTGVQTKGIYQYVRHPMYTTLLATCVGWSLVTDSATRLILTALLVGILNLKSDQEEEVLLAEFPEEYKQYQEQVTGKFFPLELVAEAKSKVMNK